MNLLFQRSSLFDETSSNLSFFKPHFVPLDFLLFLCLHQHTSIFPSINHDTLIILQSISPGFALVLSVSWIKFLIFQVSLSVLSYVNHHFAIHFACFRLCYACFLNKVFDFSSFFVSFVIRQSSFCNSFRLFSPLLCMFLE